MSRFAVTITALFVLLGASHTLAQTSPADSDMTSVQPDGLNSDVQSRVLDELAALRQQVTELQNSISDVPRLRQEVRSLGEQVTLLSRSVDDLRDSRQLADNVLGAMEEDEEVRRHVGELAQGKVIIYNDREYDAPIYINGTRWSAVRGRSYVFVPAGNVLFQEPHDLRPELKDRNSWRLIDGELQMSYVIER